MAWCVRIHIVRAELSIQGGGTPSGQIVKSLYNSVCLFFPFRNQQTAPNIIQTHTRLQIAKPILNQPECTPNNVALPPGWAQSKVTVPSGSAFHPPVHGQESWMTQHGCRASVACWWLWAGLAWVRCRVRSPGGGTSNPKWEVWALLSADNFPTAIKQQMIRVNQSTPGLWMQRNLEFRISRVLYI